MDLVAKKSLSFITTFLDSIFDAIKKSTGFFFNFIDQADPLQAFNPAMMYTSLVRWIFPILAVIIFCRCVLPLLYDDGYDKVWGFLDIPNGDSIPIKHWENSIGRSRLSDIIINLPFISRSHAVLRFDGKHWYITDLGSKGGVEVNDEQIEGTTKVQYGDTISLAGFESFLLPAVAEQKSLPPGGYLRWLSLLKSKYIFTSKKTLYLIMAFQLLGTIQISLSIGKDAAILQTLIGSFIVFIIAEMLIYVFLTRISKKYIELELLVFFLCGINFLIVSAVSPNLLNKQLFAMLIGVVTYFTIGIIIRNTRWINIFKYLLIGGAILLMLLNLTIGVTRFGSKNWIDLGFITFQPMEFVKVAFVMAGTATLDKLLTSRNLSAFIGFSGACIFALVLMRDLGTALVFFFAFIVIAFMRSGDFRTLALITSGAGLAAFAVISLMPYIAARFKAWGHVWEYADTIGYQQTRTMIATASGGLLGVGGGNGQLIKIGAADTDLVFGVLCEEWGLIIGLIVILSIIFFSILAVFLTKMSRSSLYSIAACGATSFFLIQTALNVFGSLDLLPLTGVTLPFVSNGGTSMITSWALLAFVKAADERVRKNPDSEEGADHK